jgi:uncharacterized membrane protein
MMLTTEKAHFIFHVVAEIQAKQLIRIMDIVIIMKENLKMVNFMDMESLLWAMKLQRENGKREL